MRDFATLRARFWTHGTGKALRGDHEARELALYLLSAPTSNLIGLYYLPLPVLAHELGMTPQGAREALARVELSGFALYDDDAEYVFVPNFARDQVGDRLHPNDNRAIGIARELEKHRKSPFYARFLEVYGEAYGLERLLKNLDQSEPPESPYRVPSKPGSGSGSGSGTRSGGREGDPEPLESPSGVDEVLPTFTAERMAIVFRRAYLAARHDDPAMGGKNVGQLHSRVVATAHARNADPEVLFVHALERWLRKDPSVVERRAPYACFAAAWGELVEPSKGARGSRHDSLTRQMGEALRSGNDALYTQLKRELEKTEVPRAAQ